VNDLAEDSLQAHAGHMAAPASTTLK
jgi:hypothetical protein